MPSIALRNNARTAGEPSNSTQSWQVRQHACRTNEALSANRPQLPMSHRIFFSQTWAAGLQIRGKPALPGSILATDSTVPKVASPACHRCSQAKSAKTEWPQTFKPVSIHLAVSLTVGILWALRRHQTLPHTKDFHVHWATLSPELKSLGAGSTIFVNLDPTGSAISPHKGRSGMPRSESIHHSYL